MDTKHQIEYPEQPFDLAFHPSQNIICAALINGCVVAHSYLDDFDAMKIKCTMTIQPHTKSCRSVEFSQDGASIFSGSKDKSLKQIDFATTKITGSFIKAHETAINKIKVLDANLIASGDEAGVVKVWDLRQQKATREYTANEDFISDFAYVEDKKTLLASSADGCLSVFDIRQRKPVKLSENQHDELLSVVVVKDGKKAVVGTQDGILEIFSWGNWGDCTDRIPGHPSSVDAIAKLDEQTICTGSSDGIIRMISILPNRVLRVVGDLNGFPVESLEVDRNGWLASCSHDQIVRFWNVEEREIVERDVDEKNEDSEGTSDSNDDKKANNDSDDSDSESDHAPVMPKKRKSKIKNAFKTTGSKSAFFADMD